MYEDVLLTTDHFYSVLWSHCLFLRGLTVACAEPRCQYLNQFLGRFCKYDTTPNAGIMPALGVNLTKKLHYFCIERLRHRRNLK